MDISLGLGQTSRYIHQLCNDGIRHIRRIWLFLSKPLYSRHFQHIQLFLSPYVRNKSGQMKSQVSASSEALFGASLLSKNICVAILCSRYRRVVHASQKRRQYRNHAPNKSSICLCAQIAGDSRGLATLTGSTRALQNVLSIGKVERAR